MGEVVGAGVRCDVCGYELRGLAVSGACPECGAPIEASWRPRGSLRLADPAWVRGVVRGLWLMVWSVRAIGVMGIGLYFAGLYAAGVPGWEAPVAAVVLAAALAVVVAASFLVQSVGAWLVARVPASGYAPTLRARAMMRWSGAGLIVIPGYWAMTGEFTRSGGLEVVEWALLVASMVVGTAYLFATVTVVEGLERRAVGFSLENQLWFSRYRRNVAIALSLIAGLAIVVGVWRGASKGEWETMILVIVIALVLLEPAIARVADATRLALAVAEVRARGVEGS